MLKTKEEFIRDAKIKHGELYDYSLVNYVNSKKHTTFICKIHGEFSQTPSCHLKGGCNSCARVKSNLVLSKKKLSKEEAIKALPEDIREEIQIIEYFHSSRVLISTKHGLCLGSLGNIIKNKKCSVRTAVNRTEFFKSMLKERYPNYEESYKIIGKVTRTNKKIKVQNDYGVFEITPDNLLRGIIPAITNCIDKEAYSIKIFNELHNNKYTYPDFKYCGSSCVIKIKCPTHGVFLQKNYVHRMGNGCTNCAKENDKGGYSKGDFIRIAKGRDCTLYFIKCFSKNEVFYKVGITLRGIKTRFREKKRMPYNYEVLHKVSSKDAGCIYDKEKDILKVFKLFKYTPKQDFHGRTECFSTELPLDEIKQKFLPPKFLFSK